MRTAILFLLSFACIFSTATSADTIVEEIIARVNSQIVTHGDYERSKEQLRQEAQQQDPGSATKIIAEKDKDILRDLIDQQLLLEKGKDMGLTADTEVIKKLDQMRKEMNLDNMEDLEKAATAQGVSFEDFKQNMRNQIITQQVIGKEISSHMNITKEEEKKFYEEHKDQLAQPEQIRLSEILISTEKKPQENAAPADDAKILETAQSKAGDVLEQIKKGGDFVEVAKKNSDGPTAAQGGDLGYFRRGMLAKELEDKTFAMKPGDVSEVVRTKQGFVILKVAEHQQAGIPAFNEIEPKVQDAIYMQKLQPALRAYLTKLREDAYILVKQGYVDTGASPNQTQPVETNAQEAKAKELKKKKKRFGVI